MIQTEALQIIQTIAHFGSFTTAARHLHKVPSAISYTVRKTEEQLGVQLFIRDSRKVKLTPAGEHFVDRARSILDEINTLDKATRLIATGHEFELRIVLDNIINQGAVVELVSAFKEEFPGTRLYITNENYIGGWDALYHNRCQLVIGAPMTIPDEINENGILAWKNMGELHWSLVMAPAHPLAQRPAATPIFAEELQEHITIVVEDSARVLHQGGDGLSRYGHRLVMPSFRQALNCAEQGIGVCMVPGHFAEHYLRSGRLVSRPVPELNYNRKCLLAWNRENMGAGLRWCLDWLGTEEQLTKRWLSYRPDKVELDIS